MVEYIRDDRDRWEALDRGLGRRGNQSVSLAMRVKHGYPGEESQESHGNVEAGDDEEVESAVLENYSHQQGYA